MFISMPNFAPRASRSGPRGWAPLTVSEPSITLCSAGVASTSKMASGAAAMKRLRDTRYLFVIRQS